MNPILFIIWMLFCGLCGCIIASCIIKRQRIKNGHRRATTDNHGRAIGVAPQAAIPAAVAGALRPATNPIPRAPEGARAGEDPGLSPEERAPDYVEPIIGKRGWGLNYGCLQAATNGTLWLPGEPIVASCTASGSGLGTHEHSPRGVGEESVLVPVAECSCGIYASSSDEAIQFSGSSDTYVWGTVALWGKIVEYSKGWRAQYAYPHELFVYVQGDKARASKVAAELAKRYGVPARVAKRAEFEKTGNGYAKALTSMPSATTAFRNANTAVMTSWQGSIMHNIPSTSGAQAWAQSQLQSAQTIQNAFKAQNPQALAKPQPNPNFVAYSSHEAFVNAQAKAMADLAAQQKRAALQQAKLDALARMARLSNMGVSLPIEAAQDLMPDDDD